MTCITSFKINIARLSEDEVYQIIDYLGLEPGITEYFLYYGLLKRDTEEEDFKLYNLLHETLSILYPKKEILKRLLNIYPISYIVDVKFSNIEDEILNNTSFTIAEESKEFIDYLGCYYNLNNGYFEK
ncbi:hypothetical protein EI71_00938 [Anaeroplasma bactoclasticum]|jgi:hypothetical protein|uniref:Uncharacterized protein n=1 Tax=Anaeroplasma bactoclasticum TaxID=2088 RepID=A0A397S6B1_9MOLU|nr:hypothetical protein [Anaeroplasma bactoclasticum]RIA77784.1 hypothetical protein EI71_00938 [Anaeroplasma bactoclasticum]